MKKFTLCILAILSGCGGTSPDIHTTAPPPTVEINGKLCTQYTGPDISGMQHYVGTLHEHSSYSDGDINSIPEDYFNKIKSEGFDYVASSEHSDTFDSFTYFSVGDGCFETPDGFATCQDPTRDDVTRKWAATQEQADAASDETFLGIRGFEWTSDRFGHINVYFSENFSNAKTDGGFAGSMETFWDWFSRDPSDSAGTGGSPSSPTPNGGGSDALAHFNHPGTKCVDEADAACDWNDYELIDSAKERLFGMELYNGGGNHGERYLPFWLYAMNKGWKLSPIGAEDEHGTNFAGDNLGKTVTIASSLDETGFREAWLARRTYAVTKGYWDLRVSVELAGHPMGGEVACESGAEIQYIANISNADGSVFNAPLKLIDSTGEIVAQATGSQITLPITTTADNFYILRVDEPVADGADPTGSIAYIAPVWLTIDDSLGN